MPAAAKTASAAKTTMSSTNGSTAIFGGVPMHSVEEMPDDLLKVLITGLPGSGKSTLASSVAEMGKTLYIDLIAEKGVKSWQGESWASNISIVRPDTITKLDDIYWELAAGGHGFKAVVLDSVSAAQRLAMRFHTNLDEDAVEEIKRGRKPMDLQTWGQVVGTMTDIATYWFGLGDGDRREPLHVVMTSQCKQIDEMDETVRLYPDVSPGSRAILLACPSYVLYTEKVEGDYDDAKGYARPKFLVHMGLSDKAYTKGRVPADLRDKIPPVFGRSGKSLTMKRFCTALRIPQ